MESVYCWSIKESSDDVPLEESYYRNINRVSSKPPLPPKKVLPSSCGTSLAESNCNNESMSMIASTTRRQDEVSDSLYDDVTFYNKARTLPRTSTRTDLNGNTKSSGSSIEARRASMPDMVSVMLSENDNLQSVPNSSASTHSSSLGDRPAIPGKSSSSGSNSNTSPPTSNDTRNTQAMCDSLLTDSLTVSVVLVSSLLTTHLTHLELAQSASQNHSVHQHHHPLISLSHQKRTKSSRSQKALYPSGSCSVPTQQTKRVLRISLLLTK
ncbi:unnamed protein product [Mytilus edulis]|uniref:Uncharacterized protein n=1 Tax=Mytilus edulis TaxID=6550 RepID=A0A8S3TXV1_MYTED|nr:unnamed protein product [Mytilus edulis]